MRVHAYAASYPPAAQLRLLVLAGLLLGTTIVAQSERAGASARDAWTSVFAEPPAYLHPRTAFGFDLSGLPPAAPGGVEAALLESVRGVAGRYTRAHTHMSLAVYYKIHGQRGRAATEKRKGDYWVRVARFVTEQG
jgi:hypothetical protein